jgi:hypothetical protein
VGRAAGLDAPLLVPFVRILAITNNEQQDSKIEHRTDHSTGRNPAGILLTNSMAIPDSGRITGKPEVISGRADLRHYFRPADNPGVGTFNHHKRVHRYQSDGIDSRPAVALSHSTKQRTCDRSSD